MKSIIKNVMTGLLLLTVLAMMGVQEASALPLFKDTFNARYGTATTRIDVCILCHAGPDPFANPADVPRNPYGQALNERGINAASTAADVSLALAAIESSDSDGDGFSNIFEINSRTFPGRPSDHPLNAGTRNGSIDGIARDFSTRAPIVGASVTAGGIMVTTNNLGRYDISIAPGTYTMTVTAAGFAQSTIDVAVTAVNRTEVDFDLAPPGQTAGNGTIVGVVEINKRAPIPNATVVADGVMAITDAGGNYIISIAPGEYNVTASKTGFNSSTEDVTVAAGVTVRRNFDLQSVSLIICPTYYCNIGGPGATGRIDGTVRVAATRQAISGAIVTAGGISATTDALGKFDIHIAPGTYTVTAAAAGFASSTITNKVVTAGNVTDVDFELAQAPERFFATLTGNEEVAPVATTASGTAFLELVNDGTALHFRVNVSGISNVTFSHIHLAPLGENGQIVVLLYPGLTTSGQLTGVLAEGTITAENLTGQLAGQSLGSLITNMSSGMTYVNVHTVAHGSGEIRGQIRAGQLERDIAIYDDNEDDKIQKNEAVRAVLDYFSSRIQRAQAMKVILAYFR